MGKHEPACAGQERLHAADAISSAWLGFFLEVRRLAALARARRREQSGDAADDAVEQRGSRQEAKEGA
jgi:hypothetical protein